MRNAVLVPCQISVIVILQTVSDGTQSYIAKFALYKETILFIIAILSLKSILSDDLYVSGKVSFVGVKWLYGACSAL